MVQIQYYTCTYCEHRIEQKLLGDEWLWVLAGTVTALCEGDGLHGPRCEWCLRDMTDEQCPNVKDICVDCCGED